MRKSSIVMFALLMTLSGCSLWKDDVSEQPTITQAEAEKRVEALIQATADQITPKPRLERLIQPDTDLHRCIDPADGGSEDRIVVSREYWLREIPEKQNADVARQVKSYWEAQGHRITEASGLERNQPDVLGRTRPDDFLIGIEWSTDGALRLGATSPCIWPDGTPEPS